MSDLCDKAESIGDIVHAAMDDAIKDAIEFDKYFGKRLFKKSHLKTWKKAIEYTDKIDRR